MVVISESPPLELPVLSSCIFAVFWPFWATVAVSVSAARAERKRGATARKKRGNKCYKNKLVTFSVKTQVLRPNQLCTAP